MTLLREIEKALQAHRIAPSRFGRDALNDSRLMIDLRAGRALTTKSEARVRAHLVALKVVRAPA